MPMATPTQIHSISCSLQRRSASPCRYWVPPQGEGTCQQCCQQTCCRHGWSTSQLVWTNIYARSASREAVEVLAKGKAQAWCGELVRKKTEHFFAVCILSSGARFAKLWFSHNLFQMDAFLFNRNESGIALKGGWFYRIVVSISGSSCLVWYQQP